MSYLLRQICLDNIHKANKRIKTPFTGLEAAFFHSVLNISVNIYNLNTEPMKSDIISVQLSGFLFMNFHWV